MILTEKEFRHSLPHLEKFRGKVKSVTGPGRSGAIASVYASYYLSIPFIPFGSNYSSLTPVLIIDTAQQTGRTMRKALSRFGQDGIGVALFNEPPSLRFWYENPKIEIDSVGTLEPPVTILRLAVRLAILPLIFLGKAIIAISVFTGWGATSAIKSWKEM